MPALTLAAILFAVVALAILAAAATSNRRDRSGLVLECDRHQTRRHTQNGRQ